MGETSVPTRSRFLPIKLLYNGSLPAEAPISDTRDRIDVILVRPRNPLNIGAAARAMANFGFTHLTVVAPFEPHWREAKSAVGAPELLQSAKESATLAEAVSGCVFVAGTGTLEHRRPAQPVIALPAFAAFAGKALERGGRAALVFGPEKHGLTGDDLSLCHVLVKIPTDPRQPSMNLGQAVAVCLYELARFRALAESGSTPQSAPPSRSETEPVASGSLDLLASVIEAAMIESGYSPAAMRRANRLDLRMLLRRMALTEKDAGRALRLFRRMIWRMRRGPVPDRERDSE
jgi:TrmH family RNA methyltransferase